MSELATVLPTEIERTVVTPKWHIRYVWGPLLGDHTTYVVQPAGRSVTLRKVDGTDRGQLLSLPADTIREIAQALFSAAEWAPDEEEV